MNLSLLTKRSIPTVSVTVGYQKLQIPVFETVGKQPGATVVITAGMDGDEYCGIEAAYKLICDFKQQSIAAGRLVIIPIVNLPGFENEVSYNPFDGKFPKLHYPGSQNGSPTEQLVWWLRQSYIKTASLWIDLHGASLTESLTPFVWTSQTKFQQINSCIKNILTHLEAQYVVNIVKPHLRVEKIAADGCGFIMQEAGMATRTKKDVETQVGWSKTALGCVGLIPLNGRDIPKTIFHQQYEVKSEDEGLWYPEVINDHLVVKGQFLGQLKTLDLHSEKKIHAPVGGRILWGKGGMRVKKGEVLASIAK